MESVSDGAPVGHATTAHRVEPRLLPLALAARYLSLSKAELQRLRIGQVRLGTKVLYDRNAIDAALDRLSGLDSTAVVANDDAEAALARFAQTL